MHKSLLIFVTATIFLVSCQEVEKQKLSKDENLSEIIQKSSTPHFDTIIAQMIQEQSVFVHNIDEKISDWEDIINTNTSLDVSFYDKIIEQEDGDYYLVAFDSILPAISKVKMVLDGGNFYEFEQGVGVPGVPSYGSSVTCSGCTSTGPSSAGECEPKENANGWYCTSCSSGTCTKSSTANTGGMVSN